MKRHGGQTSWFPVLWTSAVLLFVLGPLALVLIVSMTRHDYMSWPDTGLTLAWYARILERPEFITAAWHSLILALAAGCASLVLGLGAALALDRHAFPGKKWIQVALMSPLFVPMILSALAMLTVYSSYGWTDQASRLLVAHTALTLPYVIRTISTSLASLDRRQVLAARNLGADPVRTFFLVVLPQLGPGLFAAGVFAFIVSFDNVGLSLFLTGTDFNTLPVQLFSYASFNNDPLVAAISVTTVVLSILIIAAIEKVFGLERLMR